MRIGLYGGTFDPVHSGHLLVAQAAMEEGALDRLHFIPAGQSPFKPTLTPSSGALRLRLLRLALAGRPEFSVDDQEILRGGPSYTIDTVRAYQRQYPHAEFSWLIGADHVAALPQWRDARALAELVTFLVIPRPGIQPPTLPAPFRLQLLRGWPMQVSASEIRERICAGQTVRHLVPALVAEAIEREGFYHAG